MQEPTLQQTIREYEANMPKEIMDLIKSFDWKKELRTVMNQNQLMIDVSADLEESVYLMILGIVDVADVYQRLMDMHDMPEDKARKVIEEIEELIFEPLHKKLMDTEKKEATTVAMTSKNIPPLTTFASTQSNPSDSHSMRDTILAEIEKEPEPVMSIKPIIPINNQTMSAPAQNPGVTKPFSILSTSEVEVEKSIPVIQNIAQGVQVDPVSTGLGQPTVMQVPAAPQPLTKSYVADPYRESIE